MKMTRRQLDEVITNYLLSEAEFGDFGGGVNIVCFVVFVCSGCC